MGAVAGRKFGFHSLAIISKGWTICSRNLGLAFFCPPLRSVIKDLVNFLIAQFFAVSDEECWHAFGVEPKVGKPDDHEYDEEVVCTSYHSQFEPTENGEVHIRQVKEASFCQPSLILDKFEDDK